MLNTIEDWVSELTKVAQFVAHSEADESVWWGVNVWPVCASLDPRNRVLRRKSRFTSLMRGCCMQENMQTFYRKNLCWNRGKDRPRFNLLDKHNTGNHFKIRNIRQFAGLGCNLDCYCYFSYTIYWPCPQAYIDHCQALLAFKTWENIELIVLRKDLIFFILSWVGWGSNSIRFAQFPGIVELVETTRNSVCVS